MKFSDKFSSPYLKTSDLPDRRMRVTIIEITGEWMGNPKEHKYVAYFGELDKGLPLNKSNGTTLQRAFGDDVAACVGKVIDLVVKVEPVQGEDRDVLRIEIPANQPPPPSSDAALNRRLYDAAAANGRTDDDDIPF